MLGKACRADLNAIYVIPAFLCHACQGLQSRFYRYLCHSRSFLPCLARLAEQILSLFTSFPLFSATFGKASRADFVAIYVIPALFCHAWQGLQSRFKRYLKRTGITSLGSPGLSSQCVFGFSGRKAPTKYPNGLG